MHKRSNPMRHHVANTLILMAMLMAATTTAHAQVMEVEQRAKAERAAEEARKAAEAAAAARKDAAGDMKPLLGEEATKLMEQQEKAKQAAREKAARKAGLLVTDSVKWAANQKKLREWKTKWFVGGQLDLNMMVADNITDHPPFKYGETFGMGFDVYVGRHIYRNFSVRAGLSYQNAKNRADWETVEQSWQNPNTTPKAPLYNGNGFYRFSITEFYADALFDVSGSAASSRFKPLHVIAVAGVGLISAGEKKLLGTMRTPEEIGEEITYDEKGKPFVAGLPMFQGLVKTKSIISPALRLGLLFDYRVAKNLSIDVEPLITVGNDQVDGIKYAEPFDFLVNIKAGLTFRF